MPSLVDFQEYLQEQLKDPERRKNFELAKEKVNLQLIFNDLLQEVGYKNYCVEVMEMDDY
jgi:hypothetical protein